MLQDDCWSCALWLQGYLWGPHTEHLEDVAILGCDVVSFASISFVLNDLAEAFIIDQWLLFVLLHVHLPCLTDITNVLHEA